MCESLLIKEWLWDLSHKGEEEEEEKVSDCGCREKRTNWTDSAARKIGANEAFVAATQ